MIIPNSTFIFRPVVELNLCDEARTASGGACSVAYGTDPERVIKMLLGIAVCRSGGVAAARPVAVFKGFGESSLDFLLMFWADQDTRFQTTCARHLDRINVALREEGIEIPFHHKGRYEYTHRRTYPHLDSRPHLAARSNVCQ